MGPEIIIPVTLFATSFGVVYVIISARSKERLALIDKGLDASILKSSASTHGRYDALKLGILSIGIAIGVLMGNFLDKYTEIRDAPAYFSMILLFGGIALLIYYTIIRKLKPEQ